MRGVPLLPGRCPIGLQNLFDKRSHWFQPRLRSNGNLSFSGNRVGQRFAHHSPVNSQPLCYPLDRSNTAGMLTPNLFK
jgi:hypothetical protein